MGLTGVFVNLGAFYLLAHVGGVQRNAASALAIAAPSDLSEGGLGP